MEDILFISSPSVALSLGYKVAADIADAGRADFGPAPRERTTTGCSPSP
jgi:hypothetical protein